MKKNTLLSLIFILFLGMIFFTPSNSIFAANKNNDKTTKEQIEKLKKEIDGKNQATNDLVEKIKSYENNIKKKQEEELDLQNQIEIIEDDILKTGAEINKTELEVSKLKSEIKLVRSKIDETQDDINNKESQVAEYISNIYQLRQKTNLEILLTNGTFSDYFSHVEYSKQLQSELYKNLEQLTTLKDKLKSEKTELSENREEKEQKAQTLDLQKESLKGERAVKDDLLENTQEDEEKFQELVQSVKQEQAAMDSQIASLEKQMRTKIDNLNASKKKNDNTNSLKGDDSDFVLTDFNPMWPVDSQLITATFHDPTYPFRKLFEHNAIDISISQGSPIYAADNGVVVIAKNPVDASYSYIMLIHKDGFATIYGHASQVYVEPEQKIKKGEVIGLTGGMPGTFGAGSYTTGPHIHFGVRLNGVPVNPLNYLP